ncbi:MAG: hypothetical protein PHE29_05770 [Tissierellia bacterium]|nr:hypothetical protein [Tissierellia bacterium]
MLIIKSKKLVIANILIYGGLFIMLVGLIATIWLLEDSLYILLGGGFISIIGGLIKDKLYSCPRCGAKLLVVGSRIDILFGKYPKYCPNCGLEINVEIH